MHYSGPNRRSEKPGRREDDYSTCPFHDGTCQDIKRLENTTLPRWVFIWIGGPVITLLLSFSAWTAIKGLDTAERVAKVEARAEALLENTNKLLEYFEIKPSKIPHKP